MSNICLKEEDIRKFFDLDPGDEYDSDDLETVEKLRTLTYNPNFYNYYYQIDPLYFLGKFKSKPIEDAIYYLLKEQAEARLSAHCRGREEEAWGDLECMPQLPQIQISQLPQLQIIDDPNAKLSNKELFAKCKALNLKGYSKKNKAGLLELLSGR